MRRSRAAVGTTARIRRSSCGTALAQNARRDGRAAGRRPSAWPLLRLSVRRADRDDAALRVRDHRAAKARRVDRRHQDDAAQGSGLLGDRVGVLDSEVDAPVRRARSASVAVTTATTWSESRHWENGAPGIGSSSQPNTGAIERTARSRSVRVQLAHRAGVRLVDQLGAHPRAGCHRQKGGRWRRRPPQGACLSRPPSVPPVVPLRLPRHAQASARGR